MADSRYETSSQRRRMIVTPRPLFDFDMDKYEKLYKEAQERAKKLSIDGYLDAIAVEEIFPELADSEDERIRKEIINFLRSPFVTENITDEKIAPWIAYLEKQKENPKNAISIPSDCVSGAKCEDRWHKTANSLPDDGRDVLAKDAIGNYLLASFDGAQWFVSVYDGEDHPVLHTPPILEWCEIPSEKQKEQKTFGGIYWHAIKKGERLPCRAYIWNPDYEKYPDCWEGRLIPNLENICVGADTWYLPAKDVRDLPREGVDELPREQKPAEKQDYSGLTDLERAIHRGFLCAGVENVPVTIIKDTAAECIGFLALIEPEPAEWSEEDEMLRVRTINRLETLNFHGISGKEIRESIDWLKSLRPSWKPSEEQMDELAKAVILYGGGLDSLYQDLKKLM